MFNYANLNDVEFESLCKDVMEKKLSTSLRIFAKGRDGGVDLTDNTRTHNIIIQVKHYIGSKFPNLRTSLKKEIDNVRQLKPNQYFVCCGMQLTDANVNEIYDMFFDFMDTDRNIITLKEIDDFLQMPENSDVVRKHYKLWLYASNILNEIWNQNIFIDCETLLSDIDEECKYFVQTDIYNQCIEHLNNHGLLMVTGGPGVGKTITSKMLVLYYATKDYRVRYTTNGDITDIKKSLASDKDCKEIVLLDDCLGQHYFNMKQTQENELLSLIKYVKLSKNKKLILNSRITIFTEAKERSLDFKNFFQEKKIRNFTINMEEITPLEKAKIFYNHLVYKHIPTDYYNNIQMNKNYMKIVQHRNYTPRIIEHVTYETNYLEVSPTEYFNYIIRTLSNPNDIWKDEFERRLQEVDRVFISTLYSLTDTNVEYGVLKKCFNNRLSQMKHIDYTLNNYELTLSRLNQSIINIIDYKGNMNIGVINPSVNDYMKSVFDHNKLELNEVRRSIINYRQLERCYSVEELPDVFLHLINSNEIDNIDFATEDEKNYFITAHICKFDIKMLRYKKIIFNYLSSTYGYYTSHNDWFSHVNVLECLLNRKMYSFYSISSFILKENCIRDLLLDLDFEDLIITINLLSRFYNENKKEVFWFKAMCEKAINSTISSYVENIDISDYCDNYDIKNLINQNTKTWHFKDDLEVELDMDAATQELKKWIVDDIENEILEKLSELDDNIYIYTNMTISQSINIDGVDTIIDSYLEPGDSDYEDHGYRSSEEICISEIEAIFER